MKTKLLFTTFFLCVLISNAQNLIAYYPFNGNANDESSTKINPTYIGAGVKLTTDRFGEANKAYNFDGATNSYIRMPADLLPTTNRTISLWFNVPDVTNRPGLLGYGGNGSCGTTLLMGLNLLGAGQFYTQGHCGNNAAGYGYPTPPVNKWHHWVLTISGSSQKIYVNGQLKSTDNTFSGSTAVSGKDFSLGVITSVSGTAPYTDANVGYLNGKLDDVRIYDAAMTEEQVLSLYNTESLGLIAYYSFNDNANDQSGNGHNGSISGATSTTDRYNKSAQAYNFVYNGFSSDKIEVSGTSDLNFSTGGFSLSAWVQFSGSASTGNNYPIFSKHNCGEQSGYILMLYNGKLTFWLAGSGGYNILSTPDNYTDNTWHQVVAVYDGVTQVIYVDGLLKNSMSFTYTVFNSANWALGGYNGCNGGFNGKVDEIKVLNRALSGSEILEMYNKSIDRLVAFYPLNGNANDESGNGYNGTLINNPTFTLDRFGNPDKAISFDKNASQLVSIPDNPSLRIDTELTLSVFVKRKNLAGNHHLINKGGEYNSGSCNYDLSFSDASFVFKYNGNYHVGYVIHDMNWHQYTITTYHDSPEVKFYIDGVSSPTWINGGTVNIQPTNHSDLQIGGTIYYSDNIIDDVRIYNRILSPTEIASLYTNNALKIANAENIENVSLNNFYINKNTLYFKTPQRLNDIKSVEVYNMLGQIVFNTSKIKAEISFNYLSKGVYIVKVKDSDGKYSSLKVLIE
jgi:hypothetical protein